MADLVSLAEARQQCRLADDERGEDALLVTYITAARGVCSKFTGHDLSPTSTVAIDPDVAEVSKQAILILVAHWFENRDDPGTPAAVGWLLRTVRRRRL